MIISKDKAISITVGSNQKETIEDFVNSVIESRTNKPTTEINIDYYNELKAKIDKWDEKETPYRPKPIFNSSIAFTNVNYLYGDCKCNFQVFENQKYCPNCGQKLDWEE